MSTFNTFNDDYFNEYFGMINSSNSSNSSNISNNTNPSTGNHENSNTVGIVILVSVFVSLLICLGCVNYNNRKRKTGYNQV